MWEYKQWPVLWITEASGCSHPSLQVTSDHLRDVVCKVWFLWPRGTFDPAAGAACFTPLNWKPESTRGHKEKMAQFNKRRDRRQDIVIINNPNQDIYSGFLASLLQCGPLLTGSELWCSFNGFGRITFICWRRNIHKLHRPAIHGFVRATLIYWSLPHWVIGKKF